MGEIEYRIALSSRALAIASAIYAPTREEMRPVVFVPSDGKPDPYALPLADFKKWMTGAKVPRDLQPDFLDDYESGAHEKAVLAAQRGGIHKRQMFYRNATAIDDLCERGQEDSVRRLLREELYGIVCTVVREETKNARVPKEKSTVTLSTFNGTPVYAREVHVDTQKGYYVHPSVNDSLQECIDSEPENGRHWLVHSFEGRSLPVLAYVLERTLELEELRTCNRTPGFSRKELVDKTGLSLAAVKDAWDGLMGLLSQRTIMGRRGRYRHHLVLPPCRRDLVQGIVKSA